MLLEGKVAVVYGGGGVVGGAVALAFARAGARVHLAGRSRPKLERTASEITKEGGKVHVAEVDALDERAVARHVEAAVAEDGRIDVVLNAIGVMHVQGTPFLELSLADFERPLHAYARSLFVTAQATGRAMAARRSGVFLAISTPASKIGFAGVAGFGTTCAAIEGLCRHLAMELGPEGVRVLCLRPDALPEAVRRGSHSREVFEPFAKRAGVTVEAMLSGPNASALKRFPTIAEVANAAVFAASDHAGAMTGTVINLTCGSVVD